MSTLRSSLRLTTTTLTSPALRTRGQIRTMATRQTRFQLNTGAQIPAVGFGTFQDPGAQEDAVSRALKAGLRLIDTARVYDVEKQVGKGIKASGIPREDIFLGTKLWCNSFHPDDVEKSLDESLADLDTPYVDLLMMHYPCTFARGEERFPRDANGKMIPGETSYVDTWKAMEKLVKTGKTRAIGVSNFSKGELETIMEECTVVGASPTGVTRESTNTSLPRSPPSIRWKSTRTSNRNPLTSGSPPRESTSSSLAPWET